MSTVSPDTSGFHTFDTKKSLFLSPLMVIIILIAILLGIITGYFLSTRGSVSVTSQNTSTGNTSSAVKPGTVIGSNDTTVFKDSAEGTLQTGGIGNEGQYHLVRPGGDSQNVYLTSSSVDLSQFVNHKIKVWGATQKAKEAGWLMDVGRVEVLE